MANPSKAKGTGGETELRLLLADVMPRLVRTPASSIVDLSQPGTSENEHSVELLATRPDRGRWLVTMSLEDLKRLWELADPHDSVLIEVKRYARFAHHAIFERKFPRVRAELTYDEQQERGNYV